MSGFDRQMLRDILRMAMRQREEMGNYYRRGALERIEAACMDYNSRETIIDRAADAMAKEERSKPWCDA